MSDSKTLEGWRFAVPLEEATVEGLVLRHVPSAHLAVCYFFRGGLGDDMAPDSAGSLWVHRCSDLALVNGRWPVLGPLEPWDTAHWALPSFVGSEGGRRTVVTYDDRTLRLAEWRFAEPAEDLTRLPDDGDAQVGFVEKRLQRLLRELTR